MAMLLKNIIFHPTHRLPKLSLFKVECTAWD
uniref:Uncharacterized protein n=1 Tax=Anguilla anguilla TaxID=7936 RepID=A0A0E9V0M1_ANGAN